MLSHSSSCLTRVSHNKKIHSTLHQFYSFLTTHGFLHDSDERSVPKELENSNEKDISKRATDRDEKENKRWGNWTSQSFITFKGLEWSNPKLRRRKVDQIFPCSPFFFHAYDETDFAWGREGGGGRWVFVTLWFEFKEADSESVHKSEKSEELIANLDFSFGFS